MARTDSDDSVTTPGENQSGAATPSTTTTSRQPSEAQGNNAGECEVSDEDEEPVRAAGSRNTPRRSAAAAASKKLTLPPQHMSSDLSDANASSDEDSNVKSKFWKGKGKQVITVSDSEDDAAVPDEEDEEMDELDDDEDVAKVRALAKAFKTASGAALVTKPPRAKALSSSIASKLAKGKGKAAKPTFKVVVPAPSLSRGSSASKKANSSAAKGKGKAIIVSSDSDEGSDFKSPSEAEESDGGLNSDVEMEMAEFLSDVDSSEDEKVDHAAKRKQMAKRAKTDQVDRIPPRKGVEISPKQKGEMKKMSQFDKTAISLNANHPELVNCWTDLAAIPVTIPTKAIQPAGMAQKLLPFQLEGLHWMMEQEKGPWGGGMLADEMGMGKTIQTISLILSDHTPGGDRKCTLVLAPTVAIMQWKHEIEKFTIGMKVLVFHGTNRLANVKELEKYDVILTSYAVMESGFRREQKGFQRKGKLLKEDSIIHKVKWHRVILDEAHNIKDRACNTAKAAFALKSKFRWCLSGTPLQNRVGELYSLIRFLGADPFSYYFCKKCDCKSLHWLCNKGPCSECRHSGMQHVCYWNNDILKPIQYGGAASGEGERAFKKLTNLLERMMLRRTKVERADDLGLPPRVVNVRRDYFTEEEEEIYMSLFKDVKRKFSTYAHEGTFLSNAGPQQLLEHVKLANLLASGYLLTETSISLSFTLITRMRQMADHPSLVTHSKTAMSIEHAPEDKLEEILTCRLCLDEAEDAVATSCRHIFCRECVRQYMETAIEQKPECPVCHLNMTIDLDQDAIEQDMTGRQGILGRLDPSKNRTSTKIEALVEELSKLRTEDHTLKSLVFSQFTSMLDLVARSLQLGGFKVVRLQGSMTPTARDNTIKHFMNNPEVTVFLISLKAGIHRLGQHRPVVVTRLIIENSIESRILELQKKKENLAASALGDDDKAMGRVRGSLLWPRDNFFGLTLDLPRQLTPEDLRFLFSL
ncbi:DNA repair protein RAD16, partial [Phenoliferia sp. Uapishka_3]